MSRSVSLTEKQFRPLADILVVISCRLALSALPRTFDAAIKMSAERSLAHMTLVQSHVRFTPESGIPHHSFQNVR